MLLVLASSRKGERGVGRDFAWSGRSLGPGRARLKFSLALAIVVFTVWKAANHVRLAPHSMEGVERDSSTRT